MRIDAEKDFHGYREAEMLACLERSWSNGVWSGLKRVRLIHGTGEVLFRTARQWADGKGIPWSTEPNNPGVTILHPGLASPYTSAPTKKATITQKHRPIRQPGRVDPVEDEAAKKLMEQEFHRLGSEDPNQTLRHKRS